MVINIEDLIGQLGAPVPIVVVFPGGIGGFLGTGIVSLFVGPLFCRLDTGCSLPGSAKASDSRRAHLMRYL